MSFLLHDPILRPLDDAGAVMPECYLQFYETETTTPTAVYADAELQTPLTNPVMANSAGALPAIYGDSAVVYRRQLYNAADELQDDTDPIHPHVQFPPGTVVFFNGDSAARDAAYPPTLWEVCDGDNGTIDFRDRFPIGASNTKDAGDTGGSTADATSSSAGAHDHGGDTDGHALTEAEGPAHRHFVAANVANTDTALTDSNQIGVSSDDSVSSGNSEYILRSAGASPDATLGRTSSTGSGDAHTHGIASGGSHDHTVPVSLPPWGALWILERKA